MSDLISRQAAIAVADYSDCVGLSVYDVKKVTDEVVKGLKRLPSAQPEEDTIEMQEADIDETMKRLRDARVTILPSAEPEIIRCKKCNHRNRYRFPPQYEERDYCEIHDKVVREDCYCSWAERII